MLAYQTVVPASRRLGSPSQNSKSISIGTFKTPIRVSSTNIQLSEFTSDGKTWRFRPCATDSICFDTPADISCDYDAEVQAFCQAAKSGKLADTGAIADQLQGDVMQFNYRLKDGAVKSVKIPCLIAQEACSVMKNQELINLSPGAVSKDGKWTKVWQDGFWLIRRVVPLDSCANGSCPIVYNNQTISMKPGDKTPDGRWELVCDNNSALTNCRLQGTKIPPPTADDAPIIVSCYFGTCKVKLHSVGDPIDVRANTDIPNTNYRLECNGDGAQASGCHIVVKSGNEVNGIAFKGCNDSGCHFTASGQDYTLLSGDYKQISGTFIRVSGSGTGTIKVEYYNGTKWIEIPAATPASIPANLGSPGGRSAGGNSSDKVTNPQQDTWYCDGNGNCGYYNGTTNDLAQLCNTKGGLSGCKNVPANTLSTNFNPPNRPDPGTATGMTGNPAQDCNANGCTICDSGGCRSDYSREFYNAVMQTHKVVNGRAVPKGNASPGNGSSANRSLGSGGGSAGGAQVHVDYCDGNGCYVINNITNSYAGYITSGQCFQGLCISCSNGQCSHTP